MVICDGFVGNVVLKLTEGLGKAIADLVRDKGEGVLADEIYSMTNQLATYGGGPLLGVNGIAVVGHGAAGSTGIATAIKTAKHVFDNDFVAAQQKELDEFPHSSFLSAVQRTSCQILCWTLLTNHEPHS